MKINLKMPNHDEGLVVDTDDYYIYIVGLKILIKMAIQSNFDCYNDLVDDVIQYMNQIQDEISNDNQTGYEFHNIKEKEDNINAREENDNNMVEYIVNDMDNSNYHAIEDMNNTHLIVNSNDYGSNSSCASTSDTANASTSDKDEGCYNYLDILKHKIVFVLIKGLFCFIIKQMLRKKNYIVLMV
ncbi:hypothetical protein [Plasmodium yoelii yoelii]|uniref:Uncharacterized protein n=1 Tax=Plasmodium yoelii yoelii TaxID=73239 RepID=Q7RHN3_PLAYO|nr:hypothetical protein [Plasmodium yoelii yoelii]